MSQSFQCVSCKHYTGLWTCKAFPSPDRIPAEIATGHFDHSEPYPGDHGIRYEVRPEWKRVIDRIYSRNRTVH